MKQIFKASSSLLIVLVMLGLSACGSAPAEYDEQDAAAQTQQVEDAIRSGIEATQQALNAAQPAETEEPEQDTQPDAVTEEPVEDPQTEFPAPNAEYEGINFFYNYELAASWLAETTQPPDPTSDNPFQRPSYYQIKLIGPEIEGYSEVDISAAIYVIPVQNMESFLDKGWALAALDMLRKILAEKPGELPNDPQKPLAMRIPVLPIDMIPSMPSQVLLSNIKYMDFEGGSGVRFLTGYDEVRMPVSQLSYNFQGLTDDGKYYVSFVFPLSNEFMDGYNASVPAITSGDWETLFNDYQSYTNGAEAALNSTPDSGFNPDLALLDTIAQSLSITR